MSAVLPLDLGPMARGGAKPPRAVVSALRRALRQRLALAFLLWAVVCLGQLELPGGSGRAEPVRPVPATRPSASMADDYGAIVRETMLADGVAGSCR